MKPLLMTLLTIAISLPAVASADEYVYRDGQRVLVIQGEPQPYHEAAPPPRPMSRAEYRRQLRAERRAIRAQRRAQRRAIRLQRRARRRYLRARAPRWEIGLHVTGAGPLTDTDEGSRAMPGAGLHIRNRFSRWFGVELALDVMGTDYADGGIRRVTTPLSGTLFLNFFPVHSRFQLFLLGGIQAAISTVEWDLPNLSDHQTFFQYGAHGGAGASFAISRNFALTADVRFFARGRDNIGEPGSYYGDIDITPVPRSEGGAQLNLGFSWRF